MPSRKLGLVGRPDRGRKDPWQEREKMTEKAEGVLLVLRSHSLMAGEGHEGWRPKAGPRGW